MQILVIVANTQVRILWTEVEKGFTSTSFDCELVGPKLKLKNFYSLYSEREID